jgi:hypothetical protein
MMNDPIAPLDCDMLREDVHHAEASTARGAGLTQRTRVFGIVFWSLGLLGAGCDVGGARCEERIALFEARLALTAADSRAIATRVELPRVDGGERIGETHVSIDLDSAALALDGWEAESPDVLVDRLEILRANHEILHPRTAPPPTHVRADAKGLVADQLPLLERIPVVQLVVAGPASAELLPFPGTPTHVREHIAYAQGSESAAVVLAAGMLDEALERSPSAAAFQGVAITAAEDDAARATRIMADAARDCGCRGIDMDLMEAGLVFVARPGGRDHRVLTTILAPSTAREDRISLPADATFSDLALAIAEREASGVTSTTWFDLR